MGQFAKVLIADGGERLTHEVSPTFVDRLASLRPEEVQSAAEAWIGKTCMLTPTRTSDTRR